VTATAIVGVTVIFDQGKWIESPMTLHYYAPAHAAWQLTLNAPAAGFRAEIHPEPAPESRMLPCGRLWA